MGNSSSNFACGLTFKGTIGEFPDFDAEEEAKAIHKAFHKRIGINEEKIIAIVTKLNNAQRQELADIYKGCYGEDLIKRMDKIRRDDLRRSLKALMRPPAEYAARELRKAMKGIGTDEEALIEIICTKSNEQLEKIKETYSEVFGRDLESDIESDTRGDFKRLLVAVLMAQREESDELDEEAAQADAQELYDAGENRWGTDESAFTLIFARRSLLQLRAIIAAYEEIAGNSLESAVESECSRDLRKGYKAIVRLASHPAYYYARTIQKALKGVGTDEETMIRHIVNTSETCLEQVNESFLDEAGYTLIKAIKKGFRGDAKELLKAVVRGNGCAEEWTPEMDDEEEDEEEEEEAEEPEVDDSASIQDKMKAGVTLENIYIMSEISGHVLTVPGGEEDGAVVQDEWLEEECQLWNISYDPSTKLALIASVANPDCVLTVEGGAGPGNLFLKAYEEDQVSQQWRYKMNYLFNQGNVLDVPYSSEDDGVHIGTYPRHGGDNQKWHIMQHE